MNQTEPHTSFTDQIAKRKQKYANLSHHFLLLVDGKKIEASSQHELKLGKIKQDLKLLIEAL